MKVLPKLNLNKHPEEVENGSLIDALNVIVSKDNAVLQTEPKLLENDVSSCLVDIINGETLYNILYCIPCNEEIILFVHFPINPNTIKIYRYNEKYKEAKYCTDTDYNGGTIIGTFTYNFNNLIIAFSEYFEDDDKKVPLKTINLGGFIEGFPIEDIAQLENPSLHPICPEVIIPNITTNYIYGNAYKGWYFIFVRYKISNNTYTQWFNTNKTVLVDIADEQLIEKYSLAYTNNYDTSEHLVEENKYATATVSDNISTDLDISTVSILCKTNNIDKRYKKFQYGFVIISKIYTKAFRSIDINTNINTFSVIKNNLIEYNAKDLINTYENYYNVKTLINNNNRLYIANYKEDNFLNDINIDTVFSFNFSCSSSDNSSKANTKNNSYSGTIVRNVWCVILDKEYSIPANIVIENNEISYVTIDFYDLKYYFGVSGRNNTTNDPLKNFGITNVNDTVTIEFNTNLPGGASGTRQITTKISNIIYQGNVNTGSLIHTFVVKEGLFNTVIPSSDFKIVKVNNKTITYSVNKKTLDYIKPLIGSNYLYNWFLPDISDIINDNTEPDEPTPIEPDPNPDNPTEGEIINTSTITGKYVINCANLLPDEKYAFYIHFINKYGKVSRGYNLSNFGKVEITTNPGFINNAKGFYNKNNNCIIKTPIPNKDNYINPINLIVSFNIDDEILEKLQGYGWFISYEKLDKTIIYKGMINRNFFFNSSVDTKSVAFNCDAINFEDSINMDFNTLTIVNRGFSDKENDTNFNYINNTFTNTYTNYKIVDKKLFVADSFNNINNASYINITSDESIPAGRYVAYLKNTNAGKYENNNKILIPCTGIKYFNSTEQTSDIVNTNTSFISTINALLFHDVTYNTTMNAFSKQKPFFGTLDVDTKNVLNAFANYKFKDYIDMPYECLRFNNKPDIKFFPVGGLNTTDENKKAFVKGFIVEVKDTIDLFKMPYMAIGDCYVKSLDYYYVNSNVVDDFPKTIRRSNPYQDESITNKWRQFEVEQYKNINENKGDIIKLISIGYYFIAHTQHSMFLFNGTDTINAEENNIQLKSVDIWNINYKEVTTSELGYAGIQKESSGIVGEFGYIFYDADAKRFYRYDNRQVAVIDSNIVNFLRKLDGYDAHFVNDKQRDRLIITLFKNLEYDIVLSYNYKINSFVSEHLYKFYRGFNTKENTYILSKVVLGFHDSHNNILQYSNDIFNKASVNIMINTEYFRMKYLEYLIYKLHTVTPKLINDYSPIEGQSYYYAGDELRVYSEFCDTGLLDITIDNPEENINSINDYTKPYWRYGNWHFNALRNKLKSYIEGNNNSDECSRIFGNWFVVNIVIEQDKQVEIESIDCKFEDAELI